MKRTKLLRAGRISLPRVVAGNSGTRDVPRSAAVRSPLTLADTLLRYLASRFGASHLDYKDGGLAPVDDGWETYIYHFQVQGPGILPAELRGPLTLRLFACKEGTPRGRYAFAVQGCLRKLGYPVPAPICWEEACHVLGGPFLIMEQIPGPMLLRRPLYRPWTVVAVGRLMADMQAWLHRLPTRAFAAVSGGSLLDRSLADIQRWIRQYRLSGLTPALAWLLANRPPEPATPAIVHLDFHPLNLIDRPGQPPVVLDWDMADVGDPHADIATTAALLRCAPNEGKNWWERLIIVTGRAILTAAYLHACRQRMIVDDAKLAYYEAWAIMRRLVRSARFLKSGPEVVGAKPALLRHLGHAHLQSLDRRFTYLTGVRLEPSDSTPH